MPKSVSRWLHMLVFVWGLGGVFTTTGCKLPPQQVQGNAAAQAQYPQSGVPGFQGYPSMSRSGQLQRGVDGAPAFGAGPGGSGIVPR